MLWAVWGQFQGGSLCLTSSVCWSLQYLISVLTQGRWWWTLFFFFFLGSLVQSHCGEGEMLKTNNTVMCTQSRAGLRRFPAEHRRTRAVCVLREGTGPVGLRHCVHTTVLFVCSIPPPHSMTELISLKNQHKEEVKQREPPWK